MFNSLSDRLSASFNQLRGKGVLTQADVDQTVAEIRRALLDADVALPVVRSFTKQVRAKAYGAARSKALNPGQQVVRIVNDELVEILGGESRELNRAPKGPSVIMLAGLQGAGKTTLAGKLGRWLHEDEGRRVLLVACDLQRPNAVQQLQIVGQRAGVDVWAPQPGNGVGDPVQVARSGVSEAVKAGYDTVIVDTAGRLGVDQEMMAQASAIRDAINPDEVLFVLDAMVGQDAVNTSVAFRDGVGFTGVVLSKLDGDARGGAALSVRGVTGAPVLFASTGEGLTDFERFHPDRMASRILDMGDVMTLIEAAEKTYSAKEAQDLQGKLAAGKFTLDDFLTQLAQVRKMGSMKKLLGMLPGAGQIRQQLENFDEKEIDRVEAIVHSMTPAERADVSILNGSRRARIAAGSGTSVQEINALVKRFEAARQMMARMSRGGGMPSMDSFGGPGGLPGAGKHSTQRIQKKKAKKRKKFGNPAKQKAWEAKQAGRGGAGEAVQDAPGAAFGVAQDAPSSQPTLDDLPDDLKRMLGQA